MLLNPIIAMLHNSGANRWHPIVFAESPFPGEYTPDKPIRHKSKMHHTVGFATREEAETDVKKNLAPKIEGARIELATVFIKVTLRLQWRSNGRKALSSH